MYSPQHDIEKDRGPIPRIVDFIGFTTVLWALWACGTASVFQPRRFEVGAVDPHIILDTALEVTKSFYTRYHGGLTISVDRENLMFETGYILKKTEMDFDQSDARIRTHYATPRRQKLYFWVLPTEDRTDVEYFATFEVLSVQDPDRIKNPNDVWKFIKRDEQLENLLHEKLLQRLMEKGLLE
jgi:hypothetical protein